MTTRVLTINLGAGIAPLVPWFLSLFLSFNDDLQGGSVKIFYYHDVYRLIVSMSFRSTSQKFSIDLRVFPFLLLRIYCSPSVKSEMDLSASLGVFLLCTLL